jgi:hypothetical protein
MTTPAPGRNSRIALFGDMSWTQGASFIGKGAGFSVVALLSEQR